MVRGCAWCVLCYAMVVMSTLPACDVRLGIYASLPDTCLWCEAVSTVRGCGVVVVMIILLSLQIKPSVK